MQEALFNADPAQTLCPLDKCDTIEIRKSTRNTMNMILAIPAAATAMPENPKTAAITATTRKISAHESMMNPPNVSILNLTLLAERKRKLDEHESALSCIRSAQFLHSVG